MLLAYLNRMKNLVQHNAGAVINLKTDGLWIWQAARKHERIATSL